MLEPCSQSSRHDSEMYCDFNSLGLTKAENSEGGSNQRNNYGQNIIFCSITRFNPFPPVPNL